MGIEAGFNDALTQIAKLVAENDALKKRVETVEAEVRTLGAKLAAVRGEVKMALAKLEDGTAHNHYEWILRIIDKAWP